MEIRLAESTDVSALLHIYSEYINSPVTFEYVLPTEAEFARRVQATLERYPYLVATEGGRILGYAYAHQIQSREAYQWGAELSIYLTGEARGRGIGTRLYTCLMDLLKHQGVRTVYGCVAVPNPGSERLHEKLGFQRIGVFRNAGFKNGQWISVVWFEKSIADCDTPSPLIPFPELSESVDGC